MRKPAKILLGIATIAPIVFMILMIVVIFSAFTSISSSARSGRHLNEDVFSSAIGAIFIVQMLAWLLTIGLTIFYIVNVFRNDRVAKDKKALWAVVLFLGNIMAMPVYWYLYIWREPEVPLSGWGDPGHFNNANALGRFNDAGTRESARDYGSPPPPPDWRQ
jgi:succinate dehydrogenase/fumarate reductase cytochrome b subunit